MSRPEGLLSARERREILLLKLRAWAGQPRLRFHEKSAPKAPDAVGPGAGVPPLPLRRRLAFSQHTPWEEFELFRSYGSRVRVPEGALITGGDRAWRCTEVP